MKLKLQIREKTPIGQSTLFVRLHPLTVQYLYESTISSVRNIKEDDCNWSILFEDPSNIQFLPLKITSDSKNYIYCSYNGGETELGNTVEVTNELAEPLDITHDCVTVEVLTFVMDAHSVEIEPFSTSEWELMEIYADELEGGALLNQVSIVYPGQIIQLHVGNSVIKVRVKEQGFGLNNYMRLVADTEVIVTPKPRKFESDENSEVIYKWSDPLALLPNCEDFSPAMKQLNTLFVKDTLDSLLPCPSIFTAFLHPSTLHKVAGLETVAPIDTDSVPCSSFNPSDAIAELKVGNSKYGADGKTHILAVVELRSLELVPLDAIVLHAATRMQLTSEVLEDNIQVRLLSKNEVRKRCNSLWNFVKSSMFVPKLYPMKVSYSKMEEWHRPDERCPGYNPFSSRFPSKSDIKDYLFHMGSEFENEIYLCEGSIIFIEHLSNIYPYKLYISSTSNSEEDSKEYPSSTLLLRFSELIANEAIIEEIVDARYLDDKLNLLPRNLPTTRYLGSISSIENHLFNSPINSESRVGSNNVLIFGESGSGRSYYSLVIAATMRLKWYCSTKYVDCRKLQSTHVTMKGILQTIIDEAMKACSNGSRAAVIILDNLDDLTPNAGSSDHGQNSSSQQSERSNPTLENQSKLLADYLRFLICELSRKNVAVVATCIDESNLHPSLTSLDAFWCKFKVPDITDKDKCNIITQMIGHSCNDIVDMSVHVNLMNGFIPADLNHIASKLLLCFQILKLKKVTPSNEDVKRILCEHSPIKSEVLGLEQTVSYETWDSVGGLFNAKIQLSSLVLKPMKYRKIFKQSPIPIPRGILLYGYSGCGKSMIVPALAKESNFNLVTCRGPELLDKYIGASEAKVRLLFERAYAAAPAILFLDEFDALAPRRGSDNTGVTDRVVNQLLTFLDGVEVQGSDSDKIVYIVAASSRPDKIDPALIRPGRLEKHIFIGYSESNEEWMDIFVKICCMKELAKNLQQALSFGSILTVLENENIPFRRFSPADMKGVLDTAHLIAVHEVLEGGCAKARPKISLKALVDAFKSTKPSLSEADYNFFTSIYDPFRGFQSIQSSDMSLKTALK